MLIRSYQPDDAEALVAVFQDAVIHTGIQAYSAEQTAIWASYPDEIESFRQQLSRGLTLVAVLDHKPVAFGQLDPIDYIAFLYTASFVGRSGCATAIYQQLEARSIAQQATCIRTAASRISKHFFLKVGFDLVETEWVDRKGVLLERFKMEKHLPT